MGIDRMQKKKVTSDMQEEKGECAQNPTLTPRTGVVRLCLGKRRRHFFFFSTRA